MYVGVILDLKQYLEIQFGIPHVCGGDPIAFRIGQRLFCVFPMYVGVILCKGGRGSFKSCIPHVRGGDPMLKNRQSAVEKYSPCMWG